MRGRIAYRDRFKQVLSFEGLRYNKITPTDYDCVFEFGGHAFLYIEVKSEYTEVKYGQRLCLERQVDTDQRGGCEATAIVARHNVRDPHEDVIVADCIVDEIYWREHWYKMDKHITVKEKVDSFVEYIENTKTWRNGLRQ